MNNNHQLANQLLAASIHEIKNRFGLLFSQLDNLLESLPLSEEHSEQSDQIKSEAQFIGNELMRMLASYNALEGGSVYSQDQQFLVDFLEEKVARHANTARAHHLQIRFNCDEELDAFFDDNIIGILLDTAIYNSIKAGAKTISLCAESLNSELQIQIHDDGPGFPAKMLQHHFQPTAVNYQEHSTGLGLYFANNLIQQHVEGSQTGQIELTNSDQLNGACVILHLPQ